MENVLVVFAHPYEQNSKSNKALINAVSEARNVTVHNLALEYPDGKFDIQREQSILAQHSKVIFQFPTFWFNVPGLFKTWLDEVLTYGWAYGPNGEALKDKKIGIVTTTGGEFEAYQKEGIRGFTVGDFLTPIIGSIKYVNAEFIGHVALNNAFNPSDEQLAVAVSEYKALLMR